MHASPRTGSEAFIALRRLCDGASRRNEVDTPDSWVIRGEGAQRRKEAFDALRRDPVIGPNVQRDHALSVAGIPGGSGLELLEPWVKGLLDHVLFDPGLDRTQWDDAIDRFLGVLGVRGGTVPCTIRAALAGLALQESGFELEDALVRPATGHDFIVPIGKEAPEGVVFEYRVELPARAGLHGFDFPKDVIKEVETTHQERLTRFLLAVALTTEAPVQELLVMGSIDFAGGGSGQNREAVGEIAREYQYRLDEAAIARISECYELLGEKNLRRVGVATRRFLLARTERVRPTDQIIDYAIALESMSEQSGGPKQGDELAGRVSRDDIERRVVEAEHKRFRAARRDIVHDGVIPGDAAEVAEIGSALVRKSLQALTGLMVSR